MSDYFRVLKRLERERPEREAPAQKLDGHAAGARQQATERVSVASTVTPLVAPKAALPAPAAPAMAAPATSGLPLPAPADRRDGETAPRMAAAPQGIATLLDKIRALASDRPTRMLVFAGASTAEPVGVVAAGLASHAERHGMRVLLADLRHVGGRAKLLPHAGGKTRAAHLVGSGDEPLAVDLEGGATPSDLERWLECCAPDTDLVIITGPPLGESIDAALLAGACDGLVIVAESQVTDRSALQAAAERARVAGCRTLGVVMHGGQDPLPGWMHRLMGNPLKS